MNVPGTELGSDGVKPGTFMNESPIALEHSHERLRHDPPA